MGGKRLVDHGHVGEEVGHATRDTDLHFLLLRLVLILGRLVFVVGRLVLLLRLLGDGTGMDRMAHAEEVAGQQRIVHHHLQHGIHVARLTEVEQASHAAAPTWPLRRVGGQVRIIFIIGLGQFAFLAVAQ